MNTSFNVSGVLDLPTSAFGDLMVQWLAADASEEDRSRLKCLQAFVSADPTREQLFAAKLFALDSSVRGRMLTPDRLAWLLPATSTVSAPPASTETGVEPAQPASVLWFTGAQWVRTQVAHLQEWLEGKVERLLSRAADARNASDSLFTLRAAGALRSAGKQIVTTHGASEDLVEIRVVGSKLARPPGSVHLWAGPLTLQERAAPVDANPPVAGPLFHLHGSLVLTVAEAIGPIDQGVGVLLISESPGLAFTVHLARDGDVMRGTLDEVLPLEDAPTELHRARLEARIWQSPRNRDRRMS